MFVSRLVSCFASDLDLTTVGAVWADWAAYIEVGHSFSPGRSTRCCVLCRRRNACDSLKVIHLCAEFFRLRRLVTAIYQTGADRVQPNRCRVGRR